MVLVRIIARAGSRNYYTTFLKYKREVLYLPFFGATLCGYIVNFSPTK